MHKTKDGLIQKFPQISRVITALRELGAKRDRLPLTLLLSGLFFFIIFNLLVVFFQPPYLQRLLRNPQDQEALGIVLKQNANSELAAYLKNLLQKAGGLEQIKAIEAEKLSLAEKAQRANILVRENPQYPDGYAYLAGLLYRQRDCSEAKQAIQQALELDSTRPEFWQLQKIINSCE